MATRSVEVAHDMDEAVYRDRDGFVANQIGQVLVRSYPGRGWEVEVSHKQGICKIYNKNVSRWYGYILNMKDINWPDFDRQIMRIGGELLERFRLGRGKYNEADEVEIKRDSRGHAHIDLSK